MRHKQDFGYEASVSFGNRRQDLPNCGFELKKVRGVDFKIRLGAAWNKEDPTAARDDIIDIARSLVRPGRWAQGPAVGDDSDQWRARLQSGTRRRGAVGSACAHA